MSIDRFSDMQQGEVTLSETRSRRRSMLLVLTAIVCIGSIDARADASDRPSLYAQALAATLGNDERKALQKIVDPQRQLLALRAYVRSGDKIQHRWSWTDEQIRAFEKSSEYERLLADIGAVISSFEQRNPGYTLYANTQVRSLDTQIERWNSNPRVGRTAAALYSAASQVLAKAPHKPTADDLSRFARFLTQWTPSPPSPLAAPGLSMHGQSRAIDFQIMQGGKIVAATEVSAVASEWEATGWSDRLKQAITAATPRFKGPLPAPNEPWHYEYRAADVR